MGESGPDTADDLQRFIADQCLTRPGFREAYEDAHTRHAVLDALLAERKRQRIGQTVVAERMEVTQPTVSEFEREASDPRLTTLQRYARAVGGRIEIRFRPCVDDKIGGS